MKLFQKDEFWIEIQTFFNWTFNFEKEKGKPFR